MASLLKCLLVASMTAVLFGAALPAESQSAGESLGAAAEFSVSSSRSAATAPGCVAPPAELVSWWQAESNAMDTVRGNDGALLPGVDFTPGQVGQAFRFHGTNSSYIEVADDPSLRLTNELTIEFWVKRRQLAIADYIVEKGGDWTGGKQNYAVALHNPQYHNCVHFLFANGWRGAGSVSDTNWHHCAVTARHGEVDPTIYIDGVEQPIEYRQGISTIRLYPSNRPLHIGAQVDPVTGWKYFGMADIDEVSFYSRVLSAAEVQSLYQAGGAGKCAEPVAPFFIAQPVGQTVIVDSDAALGVASGGSLPLHHQWFFEGTTLPGATNATILLTNVQMSQAGNYTVRVTNAAGFAVSSNAFLKVVLPPATVRVLSNNVVSGNPVTVPVALVANGDENALSFSLSWSRRPVTLNLSSVALGADVAEGLLVVNTNGLGQGWLGVALALPAGTTFEPGTQEIVRVTFETGLWLETKPAIVYLGFGDYPLDRQVADIDGLPLPAAFVDGAITVSGTDLEADLLPRPDGDRTFQIGDWVQAGRFAARLDTPATGGEFERADCAPRTTRGDGRIQITDWVQAGRYFARADPMTAVGGPTNELFELGPLGTFSTGSSPAGQPEASTRVLRVTSSGAFPNQILTLPVRLESQGDENALGFSLSIDPGAFTYAGATPGSDVAEASLLLNTNQILSGRLGVALALPTGHCLAAGSREVIRVVLSTVASASGSAPVTFVDQPVPRCISDSLAGELTAVYTAGSIAIAPPLLTIARSGDDIVLSWPLVAAGYALQSSEELAPAVWTNVATTAQTNAGEIRVTLPVPNQTMKVFRLRHP